MTRKLIAQIALGTIVATLSSVSCAHTNPINEAYVQLSAADWAAVCTTGSPTSASGCLGNIASPQFAKINRILLWITDFANVPVISTPNSVFIQQYGGASAVPFPASQYATVNTVAVGGGGAVCEVFTGHGQALGWQGNMGGKGSDRASTESGGAMGVSKSNVTTTARGLQLVPNGNADVNAAVPMYLLCIGSSLNGNATVPISLAGISAS